MQPRARLQPGARGGADAHRAVEVDVDHLREGLGLVLGAAADDAGAVDQHVQLAERADQRGHRRGVAHVERVAGDAGHVGARAAACASASVAPVALTSAPVGGKGARDGRADAAGAAADQHAPAAFSHVLSPVRSAARAAPRRAGIGATAP